MENNKKKNLKHPHLNNVNIDVNLDLSINLDFDLAVSLVATVISAVDVGLYYSAIYIVVLDTLFS